MPFFDIKLGKRLQKNSRVHGKVIANTLHQPRFRKLSPFKMRFICTRFTPRWTATSAIVPVLLHNSRKLRPKIWWMDISWSLLVNENHCLSSQYIPTEHMHNVRPSLAADTYASKACTQYITKINTNVYNFDTYVYFNGVCYSHNVAAQIRQNLLKILNFFLRCGINIQLTILYIISIWWSKQRNIRPVYHLQ